ncbi:MAG: hypothetical protein ABUS57_09295 [Pseudomonadota bacterium]
MGGWRDVDGNTASERRKLKRETDRAAFADTARHRPLSLLKGALGFVAVMVLVFVVIFAMR